MGKIEEIIERFPEIFRGNQTSKGNTPYSKYTIQGVWNSLGLDPCADAERLRYQEYFSGVARDTSLSHEERIDAIRELAYLDGGVDKSNLLP